MSTTHTYTVHLAIGATDDRHAVALAQRIHDLIVGYVDQMNDDDPFFVTTPSGWIIDAVDVTDSDDWAEHVPTEDVCKDCGGPGTNRLRGGDGRRWCADCMSKPYRIEDVLV